MGRVRAVVRTGDGKIQLLLPLGGLFGFGERLVPIPIESVALAGPQVMVVDMPPHRFQKVTRPGTAPNSETLAARRDHLDRPSAEPDPSRGRPHG